MDISSASSLVTRILADVLHHLGEWTALMVVAMLVSIIFSHYVHTTIGELKTGTRPRVNSAVRGAAIAFAALCIMAASCDSGWEIFAVCWGPLFGIICYRPYRALIEDATPSRKTTKTKTSEQDERMQAYADLKFRAKERLARRRARRSNQPKK